MTSAKANDKDLQRLRQACRQALERYVDLASDTNGRLTSLTPESVSDIDRVNLLLLSEKETAAYETYCKAKAALVAYLAGAKVKAAAN